MNDKLCAFDIRATDGACETCGHDAGEHWSEVFVGIEQHRCTACFRLLVSIAQAETAGVIERDARAGKPAGPDDHPFLGRVLKRCGLPSSDHLGTPDQRWADVHCLDHTFVLGIRCETCTRARRCECGEINWNCECPCPDCISGVVPVEEVVDA